MSDQLSRPKFRFVMILTLSALVIFTAGCDQSGRAWEQARTAGDPESLQNFLSEHPDSEHASAAENLLFDTLWRTANTEDEVAVWKELVDELPDHERAGEARYRLQAELVRRAWNRAGSEVQDRANLELKALVALAGTGSMPTDTTPESADAILDLLSITVREAGPNRTCGLRSVQPIEGPMPAGMSGTGSQLVASIAASLVGHSGRVTVSGAGESAALSTELPSESIFIEMRGFGTAGARIQAGHDTRYRVSGQVDGLFPGLSIIGDPDNPLVLGLWDNFGLVYLSGHGTLKLDDQTLELPGSCVVESLVAAAGEKPAAPPRAPVLKPFFRNANPRFGRMVEAAGDWAFVGSPRATGGGRIFAFRREAGRWFEYGELLPSGTRAETYGEMFAADAIGATVAALNGGAIEAFEFRKGDWQQSATLAGPETEAGFAGAVAVHGDLIAVGDPPNSRVRLYRRDGAGWSETDGLRSPGAYRFGKAVRIDDSRIVVGAAGVAYVYAKSPDGWALETTLDGGPKAASEEFGSTVGMIGELVAVGSRFSGNSANAQVPDGAGAVFLYQPDGQGNYALDRVLKPEDGAGIVGFGADIAAYGDSLLVAALGSGYYSLFGPADLDQVVMLHSLADPAAPAKTLVPLDGGTTASVDDVDASADFLLVSQSGTVSVLTP